MESKSWKCGGRGYKKNICASRPATNHCQARCNNKNTTIKSKLPISPFPPQDVHSLIASIEAIASTRRFAYFDDAPLADAPAQYPQAYYAQAQSAASQSAPVQSFPLAQGTAAQSAPSQSARAAIRKNSVRHHPYKRMYHQLSHYFLYLRCAVGSLMTSGLVAPISKPANPLSFDLSALSTYLSNLFKS